MRLVCLWIERYKCVNKSAVVLSNEYSLGEHLELKRNSQGESDRPHYGVFSSIKAIVGKNGLGKSSIIEALALVLSDSNSIRASLVVDVGGDLQVLGDECPILFNGHRIPPTDERTLFHQIGGNGNIRFKAILYSPVYNPHRDFELRKSTFISDYSSDKVYRYTRKKNQEVDIALQAQFLDEMDAFASKALDFDRFLEIDLKVADISSFRRRLARLITYNTSSSGRHLQREIAKELGFEDSLQVLDNEEDASHFIKYIRDRLKVLLEPAEEVINKEFLNLTAENQIDFMYALKALSDSFKINDVFFLPKNRERSKEITFCVIDLLRILNFPTWKRNWSAKLDQILGKSGSQFSKFRIEAKATKRILDELQLQERSFPLKLTPKEGRLAINLLAALRRENLLKYGFLIGWRGISSGQLAKLNLFSRLFAAVLADVDDLAILMDEGDIYLHPEWQRQFLNDLSGFFGSVKSIYQSKIRISMVMATHSPLMLSDLYREDVYAIQELPKSKFSSVNLAAKETFGANIFNLYKEEFFIKRSKGEFSFRAIEDLITEIEKIEVKTPDNLEHFQSRINRFGDDLIRIGLRNAWREIEFGESKKND